MAVQRPESLGLLRAAPTLARGARGWFALTVAAGCAVSVTYLVQSVLLTFAVARGLNGNPGAAGGFCAAAVLAVGVRAGLLWLREVAAARVAERVKESVRSEVFAHVLRLGPTFVTGARTGEVTATLLDGVEALDRYLAVFLPQVLVSVVSFAGALAVLAWVDPWVALCIGVAGLLAAALPRLLRRRMRAGLADYLTGWRGLSAEYLDAVQGLPTLKAIGADATYGTRLHGHAWAFHRASLRFTFVATVSAGLVGFFAAVGAATGVGVAAWRYADGALTLTALFGVLLLTREAFRPVTDLMGAFHSGQAALPAWSGIQALLAQKPAVADTGDRVLPATGHPPAVAFDAVTYRYPGTDTDALDEVSLVCRPGETTALVGPSGAGKTTLVRLLLRMADPTAGTVSLDGADLRELPLAQLRTRLGLVAQEVYLFYGTVAENIRFARPDASDDAVESAARAAQAHTFITALPSGYGTVIGDRGLRLSGGQRQRLAIARAILADPPLLLLDEPTSDVDVATEQALVDALDQLRTGRTVVVVAHRLSTILRADQVVVLDAGRVVEAAAPAELLARESAFAAMVGHQSEEIR